MSVFDVILMQSSSGYLDLLAFRALWLLLLFFPQKRAFKIMQIIPKRKCKLHVGYDSSLFSYWTWRGREIEMYVSGFSLFLTIKG